MPRSTTTWFSVSNVSAKWVGPAALAVAVVLLAACGASPAPTPNSAHTVVVPPGAHVATPSPSSTTASVSDGCPNPTTFSTGRGVAPTADNVTGLVPPAVGLVAFAPVGTGQILVAGDGVSGARVIATYRGGGSTARYFPVVHLVGSYDSAVLVLTRDLSSTGPCGGLLLVSLDGSAVRKLATAPVGFDPNLPHVAPAPDGGSIAYVTHSRGFPPPPSGLGLIDAVGVAHGLTMPIQAQESCGYSNGPPVWSPDSGRLAVPCSKRVEAYTLATGTWRALSLPPGQQVVAVTWLADSDSLLVASATSPSADLVNPSTTVGQVTIRRFDASGGGPTVVGHPSVALPISWLQGVADVAAFSPDGSWLLVADTGQIDLVNVATGMTTKVNVTLYDSTSSIRWLPDSTGFVYFDMRTGLTEQPVTGSGPVTISQFSVPLDWEWSWLGR